MELDAHLLGVFVLELKGRHFTFAATVEQVYVFCTQQLRCICGIDFCVASAYYYDIAPDVGINSRLIRGDEMQRVDNRRSVLSWNAERLGGTEAESEKDRVELGFNLFERHRC